MTTNARPALYRMDDDADSTELAPTLVGTLGPPREDTLLMASAPRLRAISSPHVGTRAAGSGAHPLGFAATIPAVPEVVDADAAQARNRMLLVAVTSFVGTLLIALPLYFFVLR